MRDPSFASSLPASEHFLDEGDYLRRRRIDQVTAADPRKTSVGKRRRQRLGRLVELRWRVGRHDEQGRLLDRRERGGVRLEPPFTCELREERRAVARERAPNLIREGAPGVLARHLADQRLGDGIDAVPCRHLAKPVTDRIHPLGCRWCELAGRIRLQQHQRPDRSG